MYASADVQRAALSPVHLPTLFGGLPRLAHAVPGRCEPRVDRCPQDTDPPVRRLGSSKLAAHLSATTVMPSEGAVTRRASVVLMLCPSKLASTAAIAIAPERDILCVTGAWKLITLPWADRVERGSCWWKSWKK